MKLFGQFGNIFLSRSIDYSFSRFASTFSTRKFVFTVVFQLVSNFACCMTQAQARIKLVVKFQLNTKNFSIALVLAGDGVAVLVVRCYYHFR